VQYIKTQILRHL